MVDHTSDSGTDRALAELGGGFTAGTLAVNGTELHHVRGGDGPPLVLLHGFPQDWYEWRILMPRLARRFTVVAVDLRGVGGSAPAKSGFDAATMAEDVHQLAAALELGPVHVVGHDIGGWVAYALSRSHPDSVRTTTVIETLVPGIEPWLELDLQVPLWHGEFHMTPELPEALVTGRQAVYFRYFFDIGTVGDGVIGDAEIAHYAWAYRDPGHLHPAFDVYRAVPENMAWNAGRTEAIAVPLLLVGGEQVFGPALPALAENLRAQYGWASVDVEVVAGGRHYLAEERPDDIAALIERHAGRT